MLFWLFQNCFILLLVFVKTSQAQMHSRYLFRTSVSVLGLKINYRVTNNKYGEAIILALQSLTSFKIYSVFTLELLLGELISRDI